MSTWRFSSRLGIPTRGHKGGRWWETDAEMAGPLVKSYPSHHCAALKDGVKLSQPKNLSQQCLAGAVCSLQRHPGERSGPSVLGACPPRPRPRVDSAGAQVPSAKHASTAMNQKCSKIEFLLFHCGFFFCLFLFLKKHTHVCYHVCAKNKDPK